MKAKAAAKKAKQSRRRKQQSPDALPSSKGGSFKNLKEPREHSSESEPAGASQAAGVSKQADVPKHTDCVAPTCKTFNEDLALQQSSTESESAATSHASLEQLFCCPLTKAVMADPVIAADGHTYERVAIQQVFFSCHF